MEEAICVWNSAELAACRQRKLGEPEAKLCAQEPDFASGALAPTAPFGFRLSSQHSGGEMSCTGLGNLLVASLSCATAFLLKGQGFRCRTAAGRDHPLDYVKTHPDVQDMSVCPHYAFFTLHGSNVNVTRIYPPQDRFEREIRPTVKKEGASIIISSSLFSFFSSSCLY